MVSKKEKEKAINNNQIILSIVFMFALVGNFIVISGIDYYYNQNGVSTEQTLFVLDTNTEFPIYSPDPTDTYSHIDIRNGEIQIFTAGHIQLNHSAVYLGNNTYSYATNGSATGTYTANYATWIINLPGMENWLMTNIKINTSANGDVDLGMALGINYHQNPFDNSIPQGETVQTWDMSSYTNRTVQHNLSLAQQLSIYDASQEQPYQTLQLTMTDASLDGISPFAWTIKIEITGVLVSGWAIQDTILISLIAFNVILTIIAVYSLDMFDMGKIVKDLKKSGRK